MFGVSDVKKEWIHFYNFFSDRINRTFWIFSQFPDETVKIAGEAQGLLTNSGYKSCYDSVNHTLREADCLFPVSSGNRESKISK